MNAARLGPVLRSHFENLQNHCLYWLVYTASLVFPASLQLLGQVGGEAGLAQCHAYRFPNLKAAQTVPGNLRAKFHFPNFIGTGGDTASKLDWYWG